MDGVSGILGRIARIEARFNPRPSNAASPQPPPPADFDPFGAAYQQAVDAASTAPASPVRHVHTPTPSSVVATAQFTTAPGLTSDGVGHHHDHASAAIAGVAAPVGAQQVGGYGSMPIPDQLAAYGNGNIPSDALSLIGQGNHRLYAPAAAAWSSLVDAAAGAGFDLRITDSYRSYEQQVDLARRKGLYSEGGLAATPGTSNHGWGLAVDADVRDHDLQHWLQANAPRFGWVEAVPREPWHWEFRPDQV